MLEVAITKTLNDFTLNSNFTSDNGILSILGPSGCGKSLTLRCIAGLLSPDKGTITLNGRTLFDSKTNINVPPRKRNIGYVFQNYALFPHLTVEKNIAFGINHIEKKSRYRMVQEIIDRIQLNGYEKNYPSQLSGGQQQRVALARTLITKPDLLLLDEPFSALDSHVKHILKKELLNIIKSNYQGIVLLVTHDVEEAYSLSDRILVFEKGQTIQIGKKEDVIQKPSNLDVARLTGCKNFFEVEIIGDEKEQFILKSKDVILRANKIRQINCKNMIAGVRAHDLKISSKPFNEINTFECEVIDKTEGIFSISVIVNCQGIALQVAVSKYDYPHLSECKCKKLFINIPPEKIFLVES